MDIEKLYVLQQKYLESLDDDLKDEWWCTERQASDSQRFVMWICDELNVPYPKAILEEQAEEELRQIEFLKQLERNQAAREARDRLVEQKKAERYAKTHGLIMDIAKK